MSPNTAQKVLVVEDERPVQHPGLIALVSADTRPEKTGSKQAAEIAIDYHLGKVTIAPPPAPPALSPGIPADLYRRLTAALLPTGFFANADTLDACFSDARISAWRRRVPEANTPNGRMMQTLSFLYEQFSADRGQGIGQENVLVLFLRVLSAQLDQGDARHQELQRLADALARVTFPSFVGGGAPLRYCWLIASVGERGSLPQALEIQGNQQGPHLTIKVEKVYDAFGIQETYDLVHHIYKDKIEKAGLQIQDVIADFTGSTKPMSTGMMLACTQLGAPMQYMYGDRDHIASVPRLVDFKYHMKDVRSNDS